MERRPLSAGVNAVPNADPDAVRRFVLQESPVTESRSSTPVETTGSPVSAIVATRIEARRRRTSAHDLTPVGLIPVTVRLRPALAGALKRASLERQLLGETIYTQQDLVEQALEPWLREQGYLT